MILLPTLKVQFPDVEMTQGPLYASLINNFAIAVDSFLASTLISASNIVGNRLIINAAATETNNDFKLIFQRNPGNQITDVTITWPATNPSNGQILQIDGNGYLAWVNPSTVGFQDPMTSVGDIIIRDLTNTTTRLPIGTSGYVLTVVNGAPAWHQTVTSLGNLSDVQITSVADANILIYSSGSSKWQNRAISGDVTISNTGAATVTKGSLVEAGSNVLTITGGTNSVLGSGTSIQVKVASGSQNGYLSSTDWTTFNNKQNAISTGSVSASYGPLSVTNGANSTFGPNVILTLPKASASQDGYLVQSDWTTFNNKSNYADPLTTRGDVLYRNASNITDRLAVGTNGQVLTTNGTDVMWGNVANTLAGLGDVSITTPADTQLLIYNSTTSKWTNVTSSGDLTNNHSGAWTIANSAITNAKVSASAAIAYSKLNLTGNILVTDLVSGFTLPINKGGTNSTSPLNNSRIMYSSGGAIVEAPALTNGQLLIGSTGGAPQAAAITGTTHQIIVTNGGGTITLSTPQSIDTTSAVKFSTLELGTSLQLDDSGDANHVTIAAPATQSASWTLTLPNSAGTNGYLLKTDGLGNTSWVSAGSGTVTSVTSAYGPLSVANSTTTPVITLPQATSSQDGYLTQGDWTTFNNKQAALTYGNISSSYGPFSVTNGANSTVGPNVTLTLQVANTSQDGYLTHADWNTFNGKLNTSFSNVSGILGTANGGTGQNSSATFPTSGTIVTGTGTTNKVVKFTTGASGIIGDSSISDNGTYVGFTEVLDIATAGSNYNEGIRIHPSSNNDYASLMLGATTGQVGTGAGAWSLIRYPATTYNNQFALRYNTTDLMTMQTGGATVFSDGVTANTFTANTSLTLKNTGNTGYVTLYAYSSGSAYAPYSLLFPQLQGGVNTLLKNDGSGNLSWTTSGNITSAYGPLSVSGGTTAALANVTFTLPQATSSQDGYLTQGDWTTFNNKSGYVTFNATAHQTTVNTSGGTTVTYGTVQDIDTVSTPKFANEVIGQGDGTGTLTSGTIRGPNGTGTNTAGVDLVIQGSLGTGNAASGNIVFKTGRLGSSGSTQATALTAMTIYNANGSPGPNPLDIQFGDPGTPPVYTALLNVSTSGTNAHPVAFYISAGTGTGNATNGSFDGIILNSPLPGNSGTGSQPVATLTFNYLGANSQLGWSTTDATVDFASSLAGSKIQTPSGNTTLYPRITVASGNVYSNSGSLLTLGAAMGAGSLTGTGTIYSDRAGVSASSNGSTNFRVHNLFVDAIYAPPGSASATTIGFSANTGFHSSLGGISAAIAGTDVLTMAPYGTFNLTTNYTGAVDPQVTSSVGAQNFTVSFNNSSTAASLAATSYTANYLATSQGGSTIVNNTNYNMPSGGTSSNNFRYGLTNNLSYGTAGQSCNWSGNTDNINGMYRNYFYGVPSNFTGTGLAQVHRLAIDSSATMTQLTGIDINIDAVGKVSGTATVTTYYGLKIEAPGSGVSLTSAYGLYVDTSYANVMGFLDVTSAVATNYGEGIRIHAASDNYAICVLGATSGLTGTGAGQWTQIKNPSNQYTLRYNSTDMVIIPSGGTAIQFTQYANGTMSFTGANGTISTSSDARLKTIVDGYLPGLNEVLQLEPRFYKWNSELEREAQVDSPEDEIDDPMASDHEDRSDVAETHLGFIAQEVGEIIPEALGMPGSDGYYGLYDRPIIAALVQAIKELSAKVDALEAKLGAKS